MQQDGRPEMTVYKLNEDPKVKTRPVGTIAMCTRDSITAPTAISWMMTDYSFLAPHEYVGRHIVQGHVLVAQRNECVARMEGDWILFIDDDMVWQPDAIKNLVETRDKYDLDMVGALCFQRGEPYQPTIFYHGGPNATGYTYLEKWTEGAAVEVDATGMAFVLIHRRVFERILGAPMPPLDDRKRLPPPGFFKWGEFGEDLMFCRDAKATGSKIYVDTSVKIGHVGSHVITERNFYEQLSLRPDAVTEIRKEQLGSLGQEAMTREEALQKLERYRE